MKIVYLHQYFKTPKEGGAVRSYHIAKKMVDEGHQVDVITSHNGTGYRIKRIDGIRVHYLPVAYHNGFGKVKRMLAFLLFNLKALRISKRMNPELCYATSTPLSIGWIALKLNKKLGTPFVFEVRDLWPEAPKQLGIIKNPLLLFLAKRLEKKVYYRADKIIALSPGMAHGIEQIVEKEKIEVFPNFSDCALALEKNDLPFTSAKLDPDKITLTYTGAIGYVNNIPLIKHIISVCDTLPNLQFIIAGDGKFKNEIESYCQSYKNSFYIGSLNKEDTYSLLNSADVSITTFLDFPILETNSPNKFFDGLACGNLSLVNNGGWTKDLVESHECGFHFTTENLSVILTLLSDDPELLNLYKKNAQRLSAQFDKDLLSEQIVTLIHDTFERTNLRSSLVYNQI